MGRPDQSLRREVRTLLKTGRVYRGRLVHVRAGRSALSKTLISIRRKLGNAVRRNLVRRRIRHICRDAGLLGPDGLLILITVSDGAAMATFAEFRSELEEAFGRLGLT